MHRHGQWFVFFGESGCADTSLPSGPTRKAAADRLRIVPMHCDDTGSYEGQQAFIPNNFPRPILTDVHERIAWVF